jgi:hypothetical protein
VYLTKYCSVDKFENEIGNACSAYGEGRGEAYTVFRWGNLRERDQLEEPVLEGRIILRWIFRTWDVGVCAGLNWFMIETGCGHL